MKHKYDVLFPTILCIILLMFLVFPCAILAEEEYEKKYQEEYPKRRLNATSPPSTQAIQNIQLHGSVRNGSTNRLIKVDKIELIKLEGGTMKNVERISPQGSDYYFSPVSRPQVPYLIRTKYQGTSYTVLIPPSPKFWNKKHILTVYESGAKKDKDIRIHSALWVVKKEKQLDIEKVFVIENHSSPPKSFALDNIPFFIPPNAKKITARIRYHDKKIPIPIQPKAKNNAYYFFYGLRPGRAELILRYITPGFQLVDQLPRSHASQERKFRVLIWRPPTAKPKIINKTISSKTVQIPQVGLAYHIDYPSDGTPVHYDFSDGGYLIDKPLESDRNPLFDEPGKTIVALFLVLIYLLALSAFLLKRNKLGRSLWLSVE